MSINQPLDPTRFGGHVAQVIRLARRGGIDQALLMGGEVPIGPPSEYATWTPLHHLRPVDNATYQAWSAYQRWALHAAKTGRKPAPTSLEARQLDRAHTILATAEVVQDRWRAAGIISSPTPAMEQLDLFDPAA